KKNYAPFIIIGMLIFLVLLGGAMLRYVLKVEKVTEDQEAATADELYKKEEYGPAGKKFEELATKFPSPNGEKYRFLADLCTVRQSVYSVTSYEKPQEAIDKMKAFIEANKNSQFAKPVPYGQDIYHTGQRLLDDVKKNA